MVQKLNAVCENLNLVTLLQQRATQTPNRCAYIFLIDGEHQECAITYKELDSQASNIATRLQALNMSNKRALLLYPPGLDYIVSFFACLYAGVIAVPVYPPSRHHLHRLKTIIQDSTPSIVLTTDVWHKKMADSALESWRQNELKWLTTDQPNTKNNSVWIPPSITKDSLAFLQYTSGSTGNPKGVMVSHGNLMANQQAIQEAFSHTQDTTVVGWLPFYHDMGLIGNILQPLYLGSPSILMSPLTFLQKPVRWLNTISKYRARTSGGPNFAYELCIQKVTEAEKALIDLSCWTLAFNGSEPVLPSTLARFSDVFGKCGFSRKAFFPCYGLAEATLFVTGKNYSAESETRQANQILVNCGNAFTNHKVCIVDPETRIPCQDGDEGEIWTTGPSVAQGYWNQPETSKEIFQAELVKLQDTKVSANKSTKRKNINTHYVTETFLRTGDLGIMQQSNLFVTGRIKDLIILRGKNYYPHDFEQALEVGVTTLRSGCSAAFSVNRGDEETLIVIAEVKRKKIKPQDAHEILLSMRHCLAEMSDAPIGILALVPPGAVPKTSSGKIQRQACKQAYLAHNLNIIAQSAENATVLPQINNNSQNNAIDYLHDTLHSSTKDQRIQLITSFLQSQLAQTLHIPEANLNPETAILSLGLDSLRAVELKHEVDRLLNQEISLSLFMSDHSIIRLAELLSDKVDLSSTTCTPSIQKHTESQSTAARDHQLAVLSCTQNAIWMVHQLEPQSIAYNLHFALRLHGHLAPETLHLVFDLLLDQHEQLRTRYFTDGNAAAQQAYISKKDRQEYFTVVNATDWSEREIQSDFTQRICQPFDLSSGNVLRITYYCINEDQYSLLLCAHHIAVDLRTCLILLNDLRLILENIKSGQKTDLPNKTTSYQDFSIWQHNYLQSTASDAAWNFWQTQLSGTLPALALPTDFLRPSVPIFRGASHAIQVNQNLTEKIKLLGQQHGATLFMVLLSAYKTLLFRYTSQNDIIVGTAHNGRSQECFANTVGNFINPIALRSFPNSTITFAAYLEQVRDTVLDALSHADFPFSMLVARLQPERGVDHWPIYQTWFGLQQEWSDMNEGLHSLALGEEGEFMKWGNLSIASQAIHEQVENFDLRVMAAENKDGLLFSFKYRSDLFETQTIKRMAEHFQIILESIVTQPSLPLQALQLLSKPEQNKQLIEWNDNKVDFPTAIYLHELFEMQVENKPTQVAVVCKGEELTYTTLNTRANQLAHYLHDQGIMPENVVGLCVERSLDMIIGILGILKTGAAYMPIDPSYPSERIAYMLADSAAAVLLTHENLVKNLPAQETRIISLDHVAKTITSKPKTKLQCIIEPNNLAYVIYTSGSTGKPKGIAVTHSNAIHSTQARVKTYQSPVESFLLLSSFAFDSSVAGIFWTLCQGGCLCLPAPGEEKEPRILGELLSNRKISHLLCLPSFYRLLLDSIPEAQFKGLKVTIVAGEICTRDLVNHHYHLFPEVSLFNEYGPSEGTVWSSVHQTLSAENNRPVPIGKPISNVQIYLLDNYLNPVPIGVTGELYISGTGLARGYLHFPKLTAEQFIPNPFLAYDKQTEQNANTRLYRTGDLARYLSNGDIEYLGRIDQQVKLRGFRIELGEIEAALTQHSQIKEAVVLVNSSAQQLVAYLVTDSLNTSFPSSTNQSNCSSSNPGDEQTIIVTSLYKVKNQQIYLLDNDHLRAFLKERLPDYMVPSEFLLLDSLPYLPNGKVDHKKLTTLGMNISRPNQIPTRPFSSLEKALADIWAEALGTIKPIGIHDNFFDLGGHSLTAIQVMVKLQDEFNLELPVSSIFEASTIAELATLIEQQEISDQDNLMLESLLDEIEQLSDAEIDALLEKPQI